MVSTDFKSEAREKLKGNWEEVACITLAYAIFPLAGYIIINNSYGFFLIIFTLFITIAQIPLGFGLTISFMNMFNGEDIKIFDFIKSGFNNFSKSLLISINILLKLIVPIVIQILSILIIAGALYFLYYSLLYESTPPYIELTTLGLGFILFVVSLIFLILKFYYYQLAFMISADKPDLSAKEAVNESRNLMTGNRAKLFTLQLSFIGWVILCSFTLGIGYLWLTPYIIFSTISFYFYLSSKQ